MHNSKKKKKIRSIATLCSVLTMLFGLIIFGGAKAYAQDEYAWVLIEKTNYDAKEALEKYNKDTDVGKNLYRYELSCSPGNYSGRATYVGGENKSSNPPMLKGETLAAQAVFGGVPDIIYPGQKVNLTLSLSVVDKNLSFYSWNAMAFADFNPPDSDPSGGVAGYPAFKNENGVNWFEINKGNDWSTINEKLSAEYRAGREVGERVALRTRFRFANWSIGTNHIYEWKMVEKAEGTVASEEQSTPGPAQGSTEPEVKEPPTSDTRDPWPENYAPKDKNGNYIDSGIRISDISGEVLIRHGDQRLGWEMVDLETIVYEGDHIFIKSRDGGCQLSLTDMTTFMMKPESELIINYDSTKKESTFVLLAGKLWVNVKKMIKDGSMNIEMSQAVAGIKGTILICESDETTSRVQVIEGEVEVTDLNGQKVLLGVGEQVAAQEGTLGKVQEFSIDEELQNWPEKTREQFYADIAERAREKAAQETSGEETAVQEASAQKTASQETDYRELFEEKIAEYERHVQSKTTLQYLLWIVSLGGIGAGIFWFMKREEK